MSQRLRISRQYWEGIYAVDFTLEGVRLRCAQIGPALLAHKLSCLIAHDTRFMAAQFARYAYRQLEAQGVPVSFCPNPAPFPAVELALDQRRADAALLLSGRNLPFWYNGMVLLTPPIDQALLTLGAGAPPATAPIEFPPAPFDQTERTQVDLRGPYLDALRDAIDVDLIRHATLTVFVDPMNGTASGYIPAAIGDGGQTKAIEINREIDPLFARQPPQPIEAGLNRLRKLVRESDSHLGVAISADGRALGVADNTGELLAPHDLALLLADYLNHEYRQRGVVVVPPIAEGVDVAALRSWESAAGLKVEFTPDPAARIAELLGQDRNSVLVGVTPNGEVTLGRYGAVPDAVLVALVLIEIAARFGSKLRTVLEQAKRKT